MTRRHRGTEAQKHRDTHLRDQGMIILMDVEAATESEPYKSTVRRFIRVFLLFGHTKLFSELDFAQKPQETILKKKKNTFSALAQSELFFFCRGDHAG